MTHPLITIALGPVLLVQGVATRLKTPRLPEPPGPRNGSAGDGPVQRLLILGDSAAAGVGAAHQDEALSGQLVARLAEQSRVHWLLVARTGATTRDALETLREMPAQPFDLVVTSLGVNDATSRVPTHAWLGQQRRLRELLRDKFAARHIVVSGLPPMHGFPALPQPLRWYLGAHASELNAALKADVGGEPAASFIDVRFTTDTSLMAPDGFHPGPPVYAEWARRIADTVRTRFPG